MPTVDMPRVIDAEEGPDGYITASVAFEDGQNQTVRLPRWASKKNLIDEAVRIREENEDRKVKTKKRDDLTK